MPTRRAAVLSLAAMSIPPHLRAQENDFPNRPIRVIAPFPPGGATDLTARVIAEGLRRAWKQPGIVENRAGASGIIGAVAASNSPPDGYTLLLGSMSLHAILPILDSKMGEAQKRLAPIGLIGTTPSYVLVPASLPVSTLGELIAYVRANPGKYPYGSAGSGASQHIFSEQVCRAAGIKMFHVPYKGSGALMTDLIAGRVIMTAEQGPAAMPHILSGRIKPLAVLSKQRTHVLPNVPTAAEAGLPGFEATIWLSVFAPAGVPSPIVSKLNAEMARIVAQPDLRAQLTAVGIDPETESPHALAERTRRDAQKYAELIRAADIRLE